MNTPLILVSLTSVMFLYLRYRYYGGIMFLHTIANLSIIFLITLLYFLTFDKNLIHNISDKEIKEVTSKTSKDVYRITTLRNNSASSTKKEFKEDREDKDKNREIFLTTLLVLLAILITVLVILYRIDKNFYQNFKSSIIGIFVIKLIDLYFIYSIKQNYKGKDMEEIRKLLMDKFKNIAT